MDRKGHRVVAVTQLRAELTGTGDLRGGIDFQNEVNVLIAAVARLDSVQDGRGLSDVSAPFGVLPERPGSAAHRRGISQARAALRSLVTSGHERYRRLIELR